jgi:mRNA interferase HicA
VKRHALISQLAARGCRLRREGVRHSIYWNPASGKTSAVPRHAEIDDKLARKICNDLVIPPPP